MSKKRRNKKRIKPNPKKDTSNKKVTKKAYASIFSLIIGVAVLIGYYVDIEQFSTNLLNKKEPAVDIAYFEKLNNQLTIVEPESISLKVTPEDYFIHKRIPFDLNIAIKNLESKSLEVVRVDLIYDKNLYIQSKGKGKIDSNGGLIIYQHNVGALDNVGFYTPLETIDTIYLPTSLLITNETIALLGDGVPMYLATVFTRVDDVKLYDLILLLGINVYCKDRPTLKGSLHVKLSCNFQALFPGKEKADVIAATKEDFHLVNQLNKNSNKVLDIWENPNGFIGHSVGYKKLIYNGGLYQLIYIDKQLRKIIANPDADNYSDYELYDTTFDGIIDKKAIFQGPEIMIDWHVEASK